LHVGFAERLGNVIDFLVKGTMPGRLICDRTAGSAILVENTVIRIRAVPGITLNFAGKNTLDMKHRKLGKSGLEVQGARYPQHLQARVGK
jgi:hypothetical protein